MKIKDNNISMETISGRSPPENKPGVCPSTKSDTQFGICVIDCTSDCQCEGNLKCCSNGCGKTCQEPVKGKTRTVFV
uniref:WAP domain-containing protein n=1 Tax=Periophthalmus magnuspinnatus TaxID=409849 RepID=A0A3B4ASW7_9GOBI